MSLQGGVKMYDSGVGAEKTNSWEKGMVGEP